MADVRVGLHQRRTNSIFRRAVRKTGKNIDAPATYPVLIPSVALAIINLNQNILVLKISDKSQQILVQKTENQAC